MAIDPSIIQKFDPRQFETARNQSISRTTYPEVFKGRVQFLKAYLMTEDGEEFAKFIRNTLCANILIRTSCNNDCQSIHNLTLKVAMDQLKSYALKNAHPNIPPPLGIQQLRPEKDPVYEPGNRANPNNYIGKKKEENSEKRAVLWL